VNQVTVACLCPPDGTRHPDGEVVTFRETIDFRTAAIARKSIEWLRYEDPDADVPEVLAVLSEFYLLHCIEAWTIRDAKGKPVEVSKPAVRQYVFSNQVASFELAEAADELYQEVILLPLVAQASKSSQPTRTNGSTSATSGSGASPRRSRRSSTASTPTVVTAPM
jgi:hypothetical protein